MYIFLELCQLEYNSETILSLFLLKISTRVWRGRGILPLWFRLNADIYTSGEPSTGVLSSYILLYASSPVFFFLKRAMMMIMMDGSDVFLYTQTYLYEH